MLIHQTLRALETAPAEVKSLINHGEIIGDGGYSRVIAKSPYEVLKVTSCTATKALLQSLSDMTLTGEVPKHLPQVYKCLGDVATDADGFTFTGFFVERLFAPDTYLERLQARRALRMDDVRDRDRGSITLSADEALALHDTVQNSFAEACGLHYDYKYEGWKESASLAGFVASDPDHPLQEVRPTFDLLESFVLENQCELDLTTTGNLLVSAHGTPVLADPVADVSLHIDNPQHIETVPGHDGLAVMELRPTAVSLSHVTLRWVTLAHASTRHEGEAFLMERRECFPHALSHQLVDWRSAQHQSLLMVWGRRLPVQRLSEKTMLNLLGPSHERHPDLAAIHVPRQVRHYFGSRFVLHHLGQSFREFMADRQRPLSVGKFPFAFQTA